MPYDFIPDSSCFQFYRSTREYSSRQNISLFTSVHNSLWDWGEGSKQLASDSR